MPANASGKPSKFWPSVGSTWDTWTDLLLATQLAGARAGFTSIGKAWHKQSPTKLVIRCTVEKTPQRNETCVAQLLIIKMVDSTRLQGRWFVEKQNIAHLTAAWHIHHTASVGTSTFLKKRSEAAINLEPGTVITGWRDFHTFEGALRSAARREGRFVRVTYDKPYQSFRCVLAAADCPFMIRFEHLAENNSQEPQFRCTNVVHRHTCVSDAFEPTDRFKWRMDFFPSVSLADGELPLHPLPRQSSTQVNRSEADNVLGWYPIRARTDDAPSSSQTSASVDEPRDSKATSSAPVPLTPSTVKLSTYGQRAEEAALEAQAAETEVDAARARLEAAEERLREKNKLVQRWRRKLAQAKAKRGAIL
ncbi:hypothetical protein BMF94_1264 [Rhodotorula taiwanensis]|uniref:Uncharacterized protein n=1 Tax=Rhodotorula taiwanensis TaxID=741276 RepID=A0A2S5BFT9_9BASI|nr:hypothetical protein BMF94_1264 [Rhodotorula taiwanensis]